MIKSSNGSSRSLNIGRVVRHMWVDGAFKPYDSQATLHGDQTKPHVPPIYELTHTYDKASNRLTRYNETATLAWNHHHEQFDYDGLHRVEEARRGEDDGQAFTFSAAYRSQKWTLDALGNWTEFATDFNDQYGDVETRGHTDANELFEQTLPDTTEVEHSFDAAGNMVAREIPSNTLTYTWDAWNRLVKVEVGENVRAEYVYNGLNWRIIKRADTGGTVGELNQERRMYYSANWQLLEEEIDEDAAQSGFSVDRRMQYVWGTPGRGYIDDIIMRRQDSNDDGTFDQTWYHITDTLFSTVAILDDAAKLVERVSYDAYGNARHHSAGDFIGDGVTSVADLNNVILANWGSYGAGDMNRDGIVNGTDMNMLLGDFGTAQPAGRISTGAGGTDNILGYAGYVFNAEVPGYSSSVAGGLSAGLYTVRHRHYAPDLGRWLSRDPIGYVDGMSLYEYSKSRSTIAMDPDGTRCKLGSTAESVYPMFCDNYQIQWCTTTFRCVMSVLPPGQGPRVWKVTGRKCDPCGDPRPRPNLPTFTSGQSLCDIYMKGSYPSGLRQEYCKQCCREKFGDVSTPPVPGRIPGPALDVPTCNPPLIACENGC